VREGVGEDQEWASASEARGRGVGVDYDTPFKAFERCIIINPEPLIDGVKLTVMG
jgi:hypothetical protein